MQVLSFLTFYSALTHTCLFQVIVSEFGNTSRPLAKPRQPTHKRYHFNQIKKCDKCRCFCNYSAWETNIFHFFLQKESFIALLKTQIIYNFFPLSRFVCVFKNIMLTISFCEENKFPFIKTNRYILILI